MKAIGYEDYQGPRLTRQQQIARMHRVIENELTEKQRRAVLGYYVDKKTMPELAREFGVCKSTVCRTIQRAEKRLRRCLRYYAIFSSSVTVETFNATGEYFSEVSHPSHAVSSTQYIGRKVLRSIQRPPTIPLS